MRTVIYVYSFPNGHLILTMVPPTDGQRSIIGGGHFANAKLNDIKKFVSLWHLDNNPIMNNET